MVMKVLCSGARYSGNMWCEFPDIKGSEPAELCALRQEGHLFRADFLDAFARLESAAMLYVEKTSVKATPSMPFSQKLTALASARDRFRNPKRLDIRIAAIRALLPVRADVVHSVVGIASRYDGQIVTRSEKRR